MKARRPVMFVILDGWGIGTDDAHNAIFLAKTPTIDHFLANYPNKPIGAAGPHIGLPQGHPGSTEMGHLIMGAGRDLLLPQMQLLGAIQSGDLRKNKVLVEAMTAAAKGSGRLHLMGLLSDGGVHTYDIACFELLAMAKLAGITQVFVHVITDGRDVPPKSAEKYIHTLQNKISTTGIGTIATVQGRWWVMDRDHRWERIESAYKLLVLGEGLQQADSVEAAVHAAYARGETDEFIQPTLVDAAGTMQTGDVVINFNFRIDREIEITQALIEPEFHHFERRHFPTLQYVGMTHYYNEMRAPAALQRVELAAKNILGEVLSKRGYSQLRLTETEKWVYVTKIFNVMQEDPFPGEERILIPSDKIDTYDLKPEMQADKIAQEAVKHLRAKAFDVYIMNFPNADMLGHTGNKAATIVGVEAIDAALKKIYAELQKQNGVLIITADHGDAEVMWDKEWDCPHTFHTDSFVPFILVDDEHKDSQLRDNGTLKDCAPTILAVLDEEQPIEMTGTSLIIPNV
ncbi:MAG: 2,3-bisphosphoglycerate-independent phosphoglycerate mutase [Candidatus Kerfeldbacteria bacterium]|nr:2,3-bisphosphoglycerate-independent phosphoglycerate mutase [Candidatus Kerfeldbacteria bacterium]